ncbi:MAG: efflux RND transporter periplasmic adaptor subunit [Aliidiomarina sp.]|uniref:efflux RND transporter periplasmic adaptor subunit n=1 Tax=Aliidiomarina sp. TaxID=1872439 RepID=UPI0025B802C4|nr:efflux RND transporter periplasmic adaptor subunit [Aliidiomarina sp.]MCH8500398.1 efflux RND transporter periplasmic adaptor subunit [Aliidiomarina sp.]
MNASFRAHSQPRRHVLATTKFVLSIGALAVLSACSGDAGNGQGNGQQGMPPSPVTIAEVQTESAVHTVQYPARVRGAREVEVRAQVSGILQQRNFQEGHAVQQGETLFQIDPEPYQLAVNSAQAELADATAMHQQAEREWQRVSGLYESNAASEREFDQARSAIEAAKARLARAESGLADARRNLRYTRVEAPINGLAGVESVTEGNLISAGAYLTHIVQTDTLHLHFAIPENDAQLYRARLQQSESQDNYAEVYNSQGQSYGIRAQINYTAPSIDAQTGRIVMRAEVDNREKILLPGQFVRVELALQTFDNIVLIDPTTVSQGQDGPQVYVVNGTEQAQARPVTLGPKVNGKQVILNGLSAGDKLIVNGHVAVRDGAPVMITNGQ